MRFYHYLFCILLAGATAACSQRATPGAPTIALGQGITATVEVRHSPYESYRPADSSIGRLFDGDRSVAWLDQDGCGSNGLSMRLVLNRPVFLRAVTLSYAGQGPSRTGAVTLSPAAEVDAPFIHADAPLRSGTQQILDLGGHPYFGVLSGSRIELRLRGCGGRSPPPISEIALDFSTVRPFVPLLGAEAIKRSVRQFCGKAHGCDDRSRPEVERLMASLIYLGLQGDKEAEAMFTSYHPARADLGEEASQLEAYYRAERAQQ